MDFMDIESLLHALRQLYGLLQNGENCLPSASSKNLDDKARLLLKHLLDDVSEKVFEAHTEKIAAACLGVSGVSFVKSRPVTPKQHPHVLPGTLRDSPGNTQGSGKYIYFGGPTSSGEQTFTMPATQIVALEPSKLSTTPSGSENKKKRCRVCQRIGVKQPKSTRENFDKEIQNLNKDINQEHLQNYWSGRFPCSSLHEAEVELNCEGKVSRTEKQRQRTNNEIQHHLNEDESSIFLCKSPSSRAVESGALFNFTSENLKKSRETDFISNEASSVIKVIESHIKALQVATENVDVLHNSTAHHGLTEMILNSTSATDSINKLEQNENFKKNELTRIGEFVLERAGSANQTQRQRIWRPNQDVSTFDLFYPGTDAFIFPDKIDESRGITLAHNKPGLGGMSIEECTSLRYKPNHVPGNNAKIVESVGKATICDDHTLNPPHNLVQDYENQNQNQMTRMEKIWNGRTSNISKSSTRPMSSIEPCRKVQVAGGNQTRMRGTAKKEDNMSHGEVRRPRLLNHKSLHRATIHDSSEDQINREQDGIQMYRALNGRRKKILTNNKDSDDSSVSFRSSSSFRSWQDSISYGHMEEYSSSNRMQSQHYSSSTSISETNSYSQSQRSWGCHSCSLSNSDTEAYSRQSGHHTSLVMGSKSERYLPQHKSQFHPVGPTRSSGSEESPLSNRDWDHLVGFNSSNENDDYPLFHKPRNSSNRRMTKLADRKKPKKEVGHLKKLKDKLKVIFHHHHHHHHHHHSDSGNHQGQSIQKHARNVVHEGNKDKVYGEQAVEKLERSVTQNKNQRGHFHALVEGLFRHVRHSTKSKQSKDCIKQLGEVQHGGKKVLKKLHWWKKVRHQGGVKMPSKQRMKIKNGCNKPRFRALSNTK